MLCFENIQTFKDELLTLQKVYIWWLFVKLVSVAFLLREMWVYLFLPLWLLIFLTFENETVTKNRSNANHMNMLCYHWEYYNKRFIEYTKFIAMKIVFDTNIEQNNRQSHFYLHIYSDHMKCTHIKTTLRITYSIIWNLCRITCAEKSSVLMQVHYSASKDGPNKSVYKAQILFWIKHTWSNQGPPPLRGSKCLPIVWTLHTWTRLLKLNKVIFQTIDMA